MGEIYIELEINSALAPLILTGQVLVPLDDIVIQVDASLMAAS